MEVEKAVLGKLGDWTGVMKSLSSEIWFKERSETQSTQSYIVATRLNYHNLDVSLGLEAMERRVDSAMPIIFVYFYQTILPISCFKIINF